MRYKRFLILSLVLWGCSKSDVQNTQPFSEDSPTQQDPIGVSKPTKTVATSKKEFCESRKKLDYFILLARESSNQLSFNNRGGIKGQGVCWWHALFQRASLYVTVFRPDLPKPSKSEAQKLVNSIASGSKIVEVPGYKNMHEFSRDWEDVIQAKLESWQKIDGFLKFAWIKGLSGSTHEEPEILKRRWDEFKNSIDAYGNIEWSMLQLTGKATHGILLLGITPGEIYNIDYIDNNYVGKVSQFSYRLGENTVDSIYGPFVPYQGRRSDLTKYKKAADKYCAKKDENSTLNEVEPDEPLNNDLD